MLKPKGIPKETKGTYVPSVELKGLGVPVKKAAPMMPKKKKSFASAMANLK